MYTKSCYRLTSIISIITFFISLNTTAQTHEIGIEFGYGRNDYDPYFRVINPFTNDRFERFELNLLYDYTFKSTNLVKIESGIDYLHVNYNHNEKYVSYVDILSIPLGFELYPDKKSILFFGGGFNFEKMLKKYTPNYNSFLLGGYLCAGLNLNIKRSRIKIKIKSSFDITNSFINDHEELGYGQNGTSVCIAYLFKLVK